MQAASGMEEDETAGEASGKSSGGAVLPEVEAYSLPSCDHLPGGCQSDGAGILDMQNGIRLLSEIGLPRQQCAQSTCQSCFYMASCILASTRLLL